MEHTMSMDYCQEEVQECVDKVNKLNILLQKGDSTVRRDLLVAARSLFLSLETPMDAVQRMTWAEVKHLSSIMEHIYADCH